MSKAMLHRGRFRKGVGHAGKHHEEVDWRGPRDMAHNLAHNPVLLMNIAAIEQGPVKGFSFKLIPRQPLFRLVYICRSPHGLEAQLSRARRRRGCPSSVHAKPLLHLFEDE